MRSLSDNYYVSSFFWSTLSKVLNALFNFLAVPLLLGLYGKADYGILAIATACNGYLSLLDLGMNTGAVKYFSQWRTEGKTDLIQEVAGTNLTFYILVAVLNIAILVAMALWGEPLFSISHTQFLTLRSCLFIIALFSIFSWAAMPFNQLLTAYKKIAFVMEVQTLLPLLKIILIVATLYTHISLTTYFFLFTLLLSSLVIPYAWRCRKDGILESLRPRRCWKSFRVVLVFSLAIFALSLFRATASQSRPILLSMFATDGSISVAEFNIISVFPTFIIMLSGTLSGIFLPQAAELVARRDQQAIEAFAYKWTMLSTVVVNILCFPVILCAKDLLNAYVGSGYENLSIWLIIWTVTVLIQMHTTAGEALILAYGRTRKLVIASASACLLSMALNIFLCRYLQVGSAVVSYLMYVVIVIGVNYALLYRDLLGLSRTQMLRSFIKPTVTGLLICALCYAIPYDFNLGIGNARWDSLVAFALKSIVWLIMYLLSLQLFRIVDIKTLLQAVRRRSDKN